MAGSAFWGTVFLAVFSTSSGVDATNFELVLLHTNDMHARFEQTTALSSRCTDADAEANRCYGGMARVASEVRKARARAASGEGPNVLFLNAGDTYQGTVWYTFHKWRIVARFINLLAFDAIEPLLAATPLANSTILVVNGTRIGVIGYLTPDTKELSKSEKVKYIDEVDAIKLEADKLKNQGINILIALGHSGFRKDIQIATEVPDIDVVIGGHTNTFLYTGNQPDLEVPESLYPHVVTQSSGRKVPVVQAYAYTKYLGQLDLVFDEHGEIISNKGNPILLDSSVTRALQNTVVGRTKVLLDGDRKNCRLVECNMGNLITDAMIDENVLDYSGSGWTDAPIAIQHGGGIRNSIENTANSGTVTRADILEVLPFENAVQKVDLKGDAVLEMLEHSVKNYDVSEAVGGFLQFSGQRFQNLLDQKENLHQEKYMLETP
uniref:5'-nucleotidase n=1 Tax=Timema monikensis TaxID=170555 RepID=A0A7R9DYG0_9NEOP|nr:unnamed protein product [Timema monikensis]